MPSQKTKRIIEDLKIGLANNTVGLTNILKEKYNCTRQNISRIYYAYLESNMEDKTLHVKVSHPVMKKLCKVCGKEKEISDFNKSARRCKECEAQHLKKCADCGVIFEDTKNTAGSYCNKCNYIRIKPYMSKYFKKPEIREKQNNTAREKRLSVQLSKTHFTEGLGI